ncbi:MAG: uncharacterized protein A8A55_0445 [Amphiamblys sp. WSBS2006]|nr:MAG: uncharacterized protein A8A55_0445 [Amphiamblys sp. WSBS2006]
MESVLNSTLSGQDKATVFVEDTNTDTTFLVVSLLRKHLLENNAVVLVLLRDSIEKYRQLLQRQGVFLSKLEGKKKLKVLSLLDSSTQEISESLPSSVSEECFVLVDDIFFPLRIGKEPQELFGLVKKIVQCPSRAVLLGSSGRAVCPQLDDIRRWIVSKTELHIVAEEIKGGHTERIHGKFTFKKQKTFPDSEGCFPETELFSITETGFETFPLGSTQLL